MLFLFLLFPYLCTRSTVPTLSQPLRPLHVPNRAGRVRQNVQLVAMRSSLPTDFARSLSGIVRSRGHSLSPFFRGLGSVAKPMQVIRVNSSRIQKRLCPLVAHHHLRRSFNTRTICPSIVSCHANKLTRRANRPNVICRVVNVGKTASIAFSSSRGVGRVTSLRPSLVVISFKAGRTRDHHCLTRTRGVRVNELLNVLGTTYPRTTFLLAAPPKTCIKHHHTHAVGPEAMATTHVVGRCTRRGGVTI